MTNTLVQIHMVWVSLLNLRPLVCPGFYSDLPNQIHLSTITFLFDKCRRSYAAVSPVTYESDIVYVTNTLTPY